MRWSSIEPIIVASSIDVQVTGETLAAKSHNQVMQNVTRKILFNNQYAENNNI